MKIFEFDYTKKDGEKSTRKVMALHASDGWVDAIDLTKLSLEEYENLKQIQLEYEGKIKPFIEKAFRRFNKSNMVILHEETIKEIK